MRIVDEEERLMGPVPPLNNEVLRLAAACLDTIDSENGIRVRGAGYATPEARRALDLALHTYNGDPEEHNPTEDESEHDAYFLAGFCAEVIRVHLGDAANPSPLTEVELLERELVAARAGHARAAECLATIRHHVSRLEHVTHAEAEARRRLDELTAKRERLRAT